MQKTPSYEGIPPGLSWNAFRSAYSKIHPKTPSAEVSVAYAEYKSGKVTVTTSPKKSPKKSIPTITKKTSIQDALDSKRYGAMKLLLAVSELDNRIDAANSAVVLAFVFGSKMPGTTETIDEIEIRLRENKQIDTLKQLASRLVFLDEQAAILQAYITKKAPRKPTVATSVSGDSILLSREVVKLTGKRQNIINYIVEHTPTKIRYVITEMREIRPNVTIWTIGGWFASVRDIEKPIPKPRSPPQKQQPQIRKKVPTLLELLESLSGYTIMARLFSLSGEASKLGNLPNISLFIPSDIVLRRELGNIADKLVEHYRHHSVLELLRSMYISNSTIDILRLNSITHYYFKGLSSLKDTSSNYTFTNANNVRVQIIPMRTEEIVAVGREVGDPANMFSYRLEASPTISTLFNSKIYHDISNGIVYPVDNVILTNEERISIAAYADKPLTKIIDDPKYSNILNLFAVTGLDKVVERQQRVTVLLPLDSTLEKALGRNVLTRLLQPVRGKLPDIPALLSILRRLIVPGRELEDLATSEETELLRVSTMDIDKRKISANRKGDITTITVAETRGEQHVRYVSRPLWLENGVVLPTDNILITDEEYREILERVSRPSSPPRLKTKEPLPLLQRKRTPPSKETLIRPLEKPKLNYIPGTYQTQEVVSGETPTKYVIVSEPYAIIYSGETKPKLSKLTDDDWSYYQPKIYNSIQLVPKRERPLFDPISVTYDKVKNHVVFQLESRQLYNRSTRTYSYPPTTAIIDQLETLISKPYSNANMLLVGIHADQV